MVTLFLSGPLTPRAEHPARHCFALSVACGFLEGGFSPMKWKNSAFLLHKQQMSTLTYASLQNNKPVKMKLRVWSNKVLVNRLV